MCEPFLPALWTCTSSQKQQELMLVISLQICECTDLCLLFGQLANIAPICAGQTVAYFARRDVGVCARARACVFV